MITLGVNRAKKVGTRRGYSPFRLLWHLCEMLGNLMEQNGGRDFNVYLSRDGRAVGLYVTTTGEAYDFELGDQLAELAAPYIERGLLDSVTFLPSSTHEELAAFFDPDKAVRVEIKHA